MKMILLILMISPTIAFADKIDWQEGKTHIEDGLSDNVGKKVAKTSESPSEEPAGRDSLYLNTLDRLQQIETINQLPATAAGDANRACKYAKNVLLEYQLAWDQMQIKGYEAADKQQAQSQISTWKKKVGEHCL